MKKRKISPKIVDLSKLDKRDRFFIHQSIHLSVVGDTPEMRAFLTEVHSCFAEGRHL
jgi:hypothetical protein